MINTNYNIAAITFTGYNKISLSKLEQYLAEGLTKKEIAEQFGVSVSTISRIIKNFGIETPNQRIKKNIDAILMPYTTQNPTLSQIIEETGLSEYMIKKWYNEKFSASPYKMKLNATINLLKSDLTNKEIAERMQLSINTIKYFRQKYNLGNIKRKKENMMKKIIEKIKEGLEKTEIAEKLGISYSTVNRYLKRLATGELKLSDD